MAAVTGSSGSAHQELGTESQSGFGFSGSEGAGGLPSSELQSGQRKDRRPLKSESQMNTK